MEKDLNALESELARSARKQDLMKIKKKWNLKTVVFGSDVTLDSARQALARDLRLELRELQQLGASKEGILQTPHGEIMAAVATSQTGRRNSAGRGDTGRYTKLAVSSALCLCGLAALKLREVQTAGSPSRATSQEPAAEDLESAHGGTKPHEASSPKASAGEERQTTPEAKESSRHQDREAGGSYFSRISEERAQVLKLGTGLVLVLGLVYYFWPNVPPQSPDSPEGQISTQETEVSLEAGRPAAGLEEATAAGSIHTRQTEVVFENAPKDSQAWDMSASVRGIKGGVSEKVRMFQR
ncbi:unnamed protein product [Symbiodinium sp. CCMP2592]|nr:unnamed protein product [Symbiodinium sp. CCMP2592]